VARTLESLPRHSRVLDIGAGVSPLPLFLAQRGAFIDCVDTHPTVRRPPPADDWNEWGFFDYGRVHPNLTAHHCTIADFAPSYSFDVIYSVSVIAHMPRLVREGALQRCRVIIQPGGVLLIPATDGPWTLSEGREVEPPAQHGTTDDILQQLGLSGFG